MTTDIDKDLPEYPEGPGYQQDSAASFEGAVYIDPLRPTLLALYHRMVIEAGPNGITGDEIAAKTGTEVYLIRPRLTDLKELGKIVSTGERREGAHGVGTTVWVAARYAPKADQPQGDLFGEAA